MIFSQYFLLCAEIFGDEQTLPLTDITAIFIPSATSRAKPLSNMKYFLAFCQRKDSDNNCKFHGRKNKPKKLEIINELLVVTLTPSIERGIFLDITRAEWRNRLCLQLHKNLKHDQLPTKILILIYKRNELFLGGIKFYGMIRAPKRATASLVELPDFSWGMNIPIKTSFGSGLACTITEKKQPPTTNTSIPIANSSFLICIYLGFGNPFFFFFSLFPF